MTQSMCRACVPFVSGKHPGGKGELVAASSMIPLIELGQLFVLQKDSTALRVRKACRDVGKLKAGVAGGGE